MRFHCTFSRLKITLVIIAALSIMTALSAHADDTTARAIMEKVDARDDGDNQSAAIITRVIFNR